MADEENMDTVPVEETKEDTPVVADEAAAKTTTVGGVIVEIDEVQMPLVIGMWNIKPKDEFFISYAHIICSSFLSLNLNLHLLIVFALDATPLV